MEITATWSESEGQLEPILVMEQALNRHEQAGRVPAYQPLPIQQEPLTKRFALQEH